MKNKVTIREKFSLFTDRWSPKIVGEVNDFYVKIFKAKGDFVWHTHENEDEFFLVIKGQLNIKLRDQEIELNEGEFYIVPKGVEHCPYALQEALNQAKEINRAYLELMNTFGT